MQNEEIIIDQNTGNTCNIKLKRKWNLIQCLSGVIVHIDGTRLACINNGEEISIPVNSGSVIELDLQTRSMHNFFTVEIADMPMIEFGFSWFGSGRIFRYYNIKLLSHFGCRITDMRQELSKFQKVENMFRYIAIAIALSFFVMIKLSLCHFVIR
jgi:hypothetical protein